MRRRSFILGYGAGLLIGLLLGVLIDSWPSTPTVEAQGTSRRDSTSPRSVSSPQSGSSLESNALVEGGRLLSEIARRIGPSVVHIQSGRTSPQGRRVQETGSGVLMASPKASGAYVVTNRHVVRNASLDSIAIRLHDGRVIHPLRRWSDDKTDIALLKVSARNLHPAEWGNSDRVEIGHFVLAMGSPFGLSHSMTLGIISAKGRRSLRLGRAEGILNQDFLQTDAAINPGNSGGPLVDMHGRVIGINAAIASSSGGNEGIGFSVPSNLVRTVADQLLEHNRVQRAYLGVKLDPSFDMETARQLELDRARGARVVEVYSDTPASRADLRTDDVILEFEGVAVQDENHLINLVSLSPVGRRATLLVWRDGREIELEVVLTDRSEAEQ